MPIIQLNFCDSSAAASTNWNTVIGGTSTGTKIASGSVINSTGGVVSGASVSVTNAWDVSLDSGGADYIAGDYPAVVKQSFWRLDGESSSGNVIVSGLGAGTAIVSFFSARDAAGPRIVDISVNGASGSSSTGATDAGLDATTPTNEWVSSAVTLGSSDSLSIAATVRTGSSYGQVNGIKINFSSSGGSPATLSTPTPSGVIGTQTTATVGATTNQSNGTLYCVASATQSHITGITAAQVIAGQNSSGAVASFSANGAVSTATPTVGMTGLSSGTLYYYAVAQVTSGGNSNVVNSSFTTASTTRSASITLYSAAGSVLASTNVRVWTRTGLSAAAADGSTAGLALTTSAGGVLNPTGLSIAAGSGWLTVKDDTDDNNCHNYPVTFS